MYFQPDTIYHVFNQGNNKMPIFFRKENYHFFLKKMRTHLLPYSHLLCYCLMPNHFHWLLIAKEEGLEKAPFKNRTFGEIQILQHQISVMLRSYTRAINVQENRSGSLFRPRTKIKDGWIDQVITVDGKQKEFFFRDDLTYARQCFHYIHQNPVKANLAIAPENWPYSSADEYANLRPNGFCNRLLAKELGLIGTE